MKCVLALDQGTTGSTALVIGDDGSILSRAYREFTQHFPQPGWVEHDPTEIWEVTLGCARTALREAGTTPEGVGITNQRETVVAWERDTGTPVHNAIVWQDRRTAERCRALKSEFGEQYIADRTGLVWDPYFSGTKIEWMLQHVPDLRRRTEDGDVVFGTIDSWLVYKLSGGAAFVTDHTNASRTLLYNIREQGWDAELLTLLGVPAQCLPEVRASSEMVTSTHPALLGVEIPVAGIAGDQQAALYGQSCWEAGQAKCTYGTGAFLLLNIGATADRAGEAAGVLTTVACDARGAPAYALEGSVFIAGAAVQWLRDQLGLVSDAGETEQLAGRVADTGGVYFVPAFVGLGAPHWEAEARGTIVGITRGTSREHVVRATLESMAFSTKDVADAMQRASGVALSELKVDGGAAANDLLIQFQADLLNVRVARPDIIETTALGAAGLAGLATGVWDSPEAFAQSRSYAWFEPGSIDPSVLDGWQRAVDATLHWARSVNGSS